MMAKRPCWMFPQRPPVFCLLGRHGDIIQMLPCLYAIWQRTGMKPVVITSNTYGSVFDGVSYVDRLQINEDWWAGVGKARQLAETLYGTGGIVFQWWNDSKQHIETLEQVHKGGVVLQCHGIGWGVDIKRWPDYGTSMADRAGFSRDEWIKLPLVFDRRSAEREAALREAVWAKNPLPKLLYKFEGHSSPFQFVPNILNPMLQQLKQTFHLVDLDKVKGHRIYDLLGLIDHAAGVLTIDTCVLHLMQASKTPYIALHVEGWTRSVPKGNCKLAVSYNTSVRRVGDILNVMKSWAPKDHVQTRMEQVPAVGS